MDTRMQCFQMLRNYTPVFLDTETTGLDSTAEIVEISIIDFFGNILVNTLVKPTGLISPLATAVHGITYETVKDAPTWPQVLPAVDQALAGKLGVIYNLDYDIRLMFQSCAPWKITPSPNFGAVGFFCAMKEYSHWVQSYDNMKKGNRWIKLEKAAEREGITMSGAHRSLDDCYTTLNVVRSVMHKINFGVIG